MSITPTYPMAQGEHQVLLNNAQWKQVFVEEKAVDEALLRLLREGVENWQILYGVALGLSASGRSRVEIMRFFWDFMVGHEGELSDSTHTSLRFLVSSSGTLMTSNNR